MPRLSEAAWAAVRARYEGSLDAVDAIAADAGISHVALWRRIKRDGWARPHQAPPMPAAADDDKLLGRLFRAFERQIADLEQRFLAGGGTVEEKDARTLSVLARTFETLAKLRKERSDGEAGTDEEHADVDLDELRERLARRLDALGEEQGDSRGADAGGHSGADGA